MESDSGVARLLEIRDGGGSVQVSRSGNVSAMDFAGSSHVHPIGGVVVAAATVLACLVRRPLVPVVVLAVASFIPSAQRIVIAGADFNFVRLMVLVCLVRLLVRGEYRWIRWNAIDTAMTVGMLARVACSPFLRGQAADLIAALGLNLEYFGGYFLFRCCFRSIGDVKLVARVAALYCVAVVPFFIVEKATGRNLFSLFGGIPEFTVVREGKLRCQGPFAHAILAGCYYVAWFPIWIAFVLAGGGRDRLLGALGLAAGAVVVFGCNSSTPLMAMFMGLTVWVAFPIRASLRYVWISGLVLLCVLHVLMKPPVWHLISRIDLVGGSTGYHRYRLIDAAVNRIGEWWISGIPSTEHWGFYLFDVANQYIWEGTRGGIWATAAIVTVFVLAYASLGRDLRRIAAERRQAEGKADPRTRQAIRFEEHMVYAIGGVFVAHMGIFLAVSYFGQTLLVWCVFTGIAGAHRQWSREANRTMTSRSPIDRAARSSCPPRLAPDRRRNVEPLPELPGGHA